MAITKTAFTQFAAEQIPAYFRADKAGHFDGVTADTGGKSCRCNGVFAREG